MFRTIYSYVLWQTNRQIHTFWMYHTLKSLQTLFTLIFNDFVYNFDFEFLLFFWFSHCSIRARFQVVLVILVRYNSNSVVIVCIVYLIAITFVSQLIVSSKLRLVVILDNTKASYRRHWCCAGFSFERVLSQRRLLFWGCVGVWCFMFYCGFACVCVCVFVWSKLYRCCIWQGTKCHLIVYSCLYRLKSSIHVLHS